MLSLLKTSNAGLLKDKDKAELAATAASLAATNEAFVATIESLRVEVQQLRNSHTEWKWQ
eukprot:scaffold8126_cov170-Amphora_coffeaeformis.AAC.13